MVLYELPVILIPLHICVMDIMQFFELETLDKRIIEARFLRKNKNRT